MKLLQGIFCVLLVASLAYAAEKVIIDDFTSSQSLQIAIQPPFPNIIASSTTGTMTGGERDMRLFGFSGTTGIFVSSQVLGGNWFLACQRGANCQSSLTFDGRDNSPNIAFSGLGSFDFTNNGANALTLTVETDINTFYNLTFYETGTNGARSASARFPTLTGPPQEYIVPFSSFTTVTGMDFTRVGSFVLFAEGGVDVDSTAQLFATFANDISGNVWRDCDRSGTKNNGELNFSGVPVTVFDAVNNDIVETVITDASGNFVASVVPGSYRVCASPSVGTPTVPANNCTTVSVVIAQDVTGINFGFTIPVTVTPPTTRNVNCSASALPPATGTATGTGCSAPTITFSDSNSTTCTGQVTITRTWTATLGPDSASGIQIVTTFDTTPPLFVGFPANRSVLCGSDLSVQAQGSPTATDNCSTGTVTSSDFPVTGTACSPTFNRQFTATDACGNFVRRNQSIATFDNVAPVIDSFPATFETTCAGVFTPDVAGVPTYTDVCNAINAPTFTDVNVTTTGCNRTTTRTWRMTDVCGNAVTRAQSIQRLDQDAPIFVTFPADREISCTASSDPSNTGTPTTSDPCGNTVTLTRADVTVPGVPCGAVITRTWTARDACGNPTSRDQIITRVDTDAPVLGTAAITNRTIFCGAATTVAALGNVTVTDCTPGTSLSISDAPYGDSCTGGFVRTFLAVDPCGNSNFARQNITILDRAAPTILTFPANFSIPCGGDATPALNGGEPTFDDACNTEDALSFSDSLPTGSICNRTVIRTWRMPDICGNVVTRNQAYFTADLTAPSLTSTPNDVTIECGSDNSTASTESPAATAVDDCGTVSRSVIDTTTGPTCNRLISRTFRFTDQCSRITNYVQRINVTDTTPPTFIFVPRDLTIGCTTNSQVVANTNGSAIATDSCTTVTITRVDVNTTLDCGTLITRTWTARDACGNSVSADQLITVTDNINPVFSSFPTNRTSNCSVTDRSPTTQGAAVATDTCSGIDDLSFTDAQTGTGCDLTITRTWTATDGCGNQITRNQALRFTDTTAPFFDQFPAPATVDCDDSTDVTAFVQPTSFADDCNVAQPITSTQVTTGTGCTRTLTRTFTLRDDCNNARTRNHVITITDQNSPVLVGTPGDIQLECRSDTSVNALGAPTSADDCGTFPVTSSDVTTGTSCNQLITRTFRVTDGCTPATTAVQRITLVDSTSPDITNIPENRDLVCGADTSVNTLGRPTATDACNTATVTNVDVSVGDNCDRTITRTFTARDTCGNINTVDQLIRLVDNVNPSFSFFPADTTLECGSGLPTSTPTATDNCNAVTITRSDSSQVGGCSDPVTRTWTATDACGNFVSRDQIVTFADRIAPVFVGFPSNLTVECTTNLDDLSITGPAPSGDDDCSDVLAPTYTDRDLTTGCNRDVLRTWTIADNCGNSRTQNQLIRVRDTQKPFFVNFPEDVSLNCEDRPSTSPDSTGTPTGDDDCNDVTITSRDRNTGLNCPSTSGIVRTWTITDPCGNSDTRDQLITLVLSQPPTIVAPDQITVECGSSIEPSVTGNPTVTSPCNVPFDLEYSDSADTGICPKTIIRTWTVTDECGNTASDVQTILQTDTTPPVFIQFPSDRTVSCEDATDPTVTGSPVAADNCDDSLCQRLTYNDVTSTGNSVGTCTPDLIIDRTWTIVDQCDNAFSRTQRITVQYVRFSGNCTQENCPADPCTPEQCSALGRVCDCCQATRSCNPVPCTPVACTPVACNPVACTCPTPNVTDIPECDDDLNVPCVPTVVYVVRNRNNSPSPNSPSPNNSPSSNNSPEEDRSSAASLFSFFSLFALLFALFFLKF